MKTYTIKVYSVNGDLIETYNNSTYYSPMQIGSGRFIDEQGKNVYVSQSAILIVKEN